MIGETFEINGKHFTIKNEFTLGDKRRINRLQSNFNDLIGKDIDVDTLVSEQSRLSNEQDELMANLLTRILGLTEDQLDKLTYPEEVSQVFQTMIQVATTPKKKESKQSDLPTSQEIQAYLK